MRRQQSECAGGAQAAIPPSRWPGQSHIFGGAHSPTSHLCWTVRGNQIDDRLFVSIRLSWRLRATQVLSHQVLQNLPPVMRKFESARGFRTWVARRPPTLKLRRVNVLSSEAAEQRRGIAGHDKFLFGPQPDPSGGTSFLSRHSVGRFSFKPRIIASSTEIPRANLPQGAAG